jgi:acetyltransferase
VLAENGPMLALCHSLGFEIALDPDDVSVKRVTLRLDAPRHSESAGKP